MVLLTADISAIAQPATTFITFIQPGWPPYVLSSLVGPSLPGLTEPYPLLTGTNPLEIVAALDAGGNPGAENRMPVQMGNRADTLRAAVVVLIRSLNLIPDRFLDRDGAQNPEEATGALFMRGDLDVGGFKIVGLSNAIDGGDLVTQAQLTVVNNDYQDNVEQIANSTAIQRDGSVAMQNALSMDANAATPNNRLINLGVPSATGLAMRKTDADTFETDFLQDYLDILGTKSMTGDLDMRETLVSSPNVIVNVGTPTAAGDGSNKSYVDLLFLSGGGVGIPVGTVLAFMGSIVPDGWELCDGRDLNRTTSSGLFAALGTLYGSSSSATFKVPDLRGRITAGIDNLGGTPANRLTAAAADATGGVLGDQDHAVTVAELPAHAHGRPDSYFANGGAGTLNGKEPADTVSTLLTTPRVTVAAGSSGAHNNIQPTLTCVWIIRG